MASPISWCLISPSIQGEARLGKSIISHNTFAGLKEILGYLVDPLKETLPVLTCWAASEIMSVSSPLLCQPCWRSMSAKLLKKHAQPGNLCLDTSVATLTSLLKKPYLQNYPRNMDSLTKRQIFFSSASRYPTDCQWASVTFMEITPIGWRRSSRQKFTEWGIVLVFRVPFLSYVLQIGSSTLASLQQNFLSTISYIIQKV